MTKQDVTLPLVMATTPVDPAMRMGRSKRSLWLLRHLLLHLVHKSALLLFVGMLSYAAYYFAGHYLIKSVKVVGCSMVPTLREGGQYLLEPRAFDKRNPQHGDIIVIRDPGDHGLSVKRVIAVGGESVLFKQGSVYVNGQKLNESYLPPHTVTCTYSKAEEQFITCGKDQYFVMGDNRVRSIDSRAYGPISRQDVLGLVKVN